MAAPDFRRATVSPPAAVPTQLPRNSLGHLPLKPAEVYVSDDTGKQLEAIGWKPGDDVPEGLPDAVEIVRKKFAGEKATADAEVAAIGATNRLRPPDPVDIRTLPEAAKAELAAFMAQAREYKKQQERAAAESMMHPGMAEAINAAERVSQPKTEFMVELPDQQPQPTPQPPQPQVKQAAPLPLAEEPAVSQTGAAAETYECQRCGWDRRVPNNVEPTEDDIRSFCVAVLSNKRFFRHVTLLGGRLELIFRSLTTNESQMVLTQLRYDVEQDGLRTDVEYLARMAMYRLALGTHRIVRADGSVLYDGPEITKIPYDPPADGRKETPLAPLLQWFMAEGVTNEDLLRVIGREHESFQRLQEKLEARTADPNFWTGIG